MRQWLAISNIPNKAETPARASAGDCLPALMMAGRSALHRCTRTLYASVKAVQGVFLQILWR